MNMTNQRRLPIRSVSNFRDLGGYRTKDGRMVRWQTLFRSGHLGKLRGRDIEQFKALGLVTVVDFRAGEEKERHPDRIPTGSNIRRVEFPILDEGNSEMMKEVRRRFEENNFDGVDTAALMGETYRQFATTFEPQYAQFAQELVNADGKPILWHCTAGKDRAGFASALTLRLLGVDLETIVADYMLSGKYSPTVTKDTILARLLRGAKAANMLKTMFGVREEWIRSTFTTIDEHWGDFDTYTQQALGLSNENIQRLREAYLKEA